LIAIVPLLASGQCRQLVTRGEAVVNPLATLVVRRFEVMPYESVWLAMQKFTRLRDNNSADEIWLLQHEPVFTLGQAGRYEHVLSPGDIPLVQSDRGGQVTYHGPGQLVAYTLLDLRRLKKGARDLVTLIEQSIIDTLSVFNVKAPARADAPGVYIDDSKIASLGLRVRRGASYHGLALNISMDLEPFQRINPCGYTGLKVVQLQDFVASASLSDVASIWLNEFNRRLGYQQLIEKKGLPNDE
jgi:lipoyl(octanoyl) transferase